MAAAFALPVVPVVFGMSHYLQDEDFVRSETQAGDEAKIVPQNVENHTVTHAVGAWVILRQVVVALPIRMLDARVPRLQVLLGGGVLFPK